MKVDRVTLTGIDNSIKISSLLSLQTIYSRPELVIEFGMLFSKSNTSPRYQTTELLESIIVKDTYKKLYLSAHLCGKFSEEVLNGNDDLVSKLSPIFKRLQINFNFTKNKKFDLLSFYSLVDKYPHNRFILQYNESNKSIIEDIINSTYNQIVSNNIQFLYDSSGGRGVIQEGSFTPPIDNFYTGYSGGFNPNNTNRVVAQLTYGIKEERRVWIDMETGIRDENDNFSISKCEKVLEILNQF